MTTRRPSLENEARRMGGWGGVEQRRREAEEKSYACKQSTKSRASCAKERRVGSGGEAKGKNGGKH